MEDTIPEPKQYSWLLLKEGEDDRNQIFFKKHVFRIRQSNSIKTVLSCHIDGWLFILEKQGRCCLFNPVTLQSIQLPSLILKEAERNIDYCGILSPSSPLESLIIIFSDYGSLMFCTVGDQQWTEQRLNDDGIDSISGPLCCDAKLYFIVDWVDRDQSQLAMIDQNIRDGRLVIHVLGSTIPLCKEHSDGIHSYLVESCGDLFLIYKIMGGKNYLELTGVEVYKLNFFLMEWSRVESAEDRVFFVDNQVGYSHRAVNPETEGNRIYFTLADRSIYSYHIQENTVLVSLPFPDLKSPWVSPLWVLPNRRLSPTVYGEIKHEVVEGKVDTNPERIKDIVPHVECRDEKAKETSCLWELPLDMLSYIASFLTFHDYINFRLLNRTCSSVASAFRMKELARNCPTPMLMFCKKGEDKCKFIDPLRLETYLMNNPNKSDEVRMCYSKQGWCLMLQGDDIIYLWNPFTKKRIPLPKSPDYLNNTIIGCEFLSPPDSSDCALVLVCDIPDVFLDFINIELENWEAINARVSRNHNPVFHNEVLYFLDTNGVLIVTKPDEYTFFRDGPCKSFYQSFLLEANGKVLAVFVGFMGKWLKVFEWIFDWGLTETNWVEVDNVSDQTLYISRISSFAAAATTEELKNTICFPRFFGDNLVYYSLTSRKFHCYGSNIVLENLYNTKEQLYTGWITQGVRNK